MAHISNKEIAEKLLETLMEKMWYREGLPSDGWAVEKILEVIEAAQQIAQADGLQVLECAECGEQTSMNHKKSCSKSRVRPLFIKRDTTES